jgi:hypothetical protein
MSMLTTFAVACMLVAIWALFNGVVSMAHGGPEDQRSSHVWMFKRVAWQGLAVLFVLMGALATLP